MKVATWLITGSTGFVGRHVVSELAGDPSIRVVGAGRAHQSGNEKLDEYVALETESIDAWMAVYCRFSPRVILHLAGRTPPADRATMFRDNVELTRVILDALTLAGSPVRFVHCGSAAELGDVPVDRLPVDEHCEPNPLTDYGRSKWDAARLVLNSPAPIEPVVGRIFNVIGPGQPANQVFGRYAREFMTTGRNRTEPLVVGGLKNRRDFVDVRDAARGLITLGREGQSGHLYHIGTGVSRSVREGLTILARLSGIDPQFDDDESAAKGPVDSIADIGRIQRDTSWRPIVTFERSIEDLWREVVGRSSMTD
ncbi:NAD-dependent epimerase/dehydratase family protein [bacterium]|nr:NAD-dependent epimerase/dehydratase family protein [bacterium]